MDAQLRVLQRGGRGALVSDSADYGAIAGSAVVKVLALDLLRDADPKRSPARVGARAGRQVLRSL